MQEIELLGPDAVLDAARMNSGVQLWRWSRYDIAGQPFVISPHSNTLQVEVE
jgi:hypothetical protein